MDFHQAYAALDAELTPQLWEYTAPDGVTLTVIPEGLTADPGEAEVTVKVTVDRALAAEVGVTTAAMPGLLDALNLGARWDHVTVTDDAISLAPDDGGGVAVTVTEAHYGPDGHDRDTVATVRLPAAQRMPLASALRRTADVAAGWEQ